MSVSFGPTAGVPTASPRERLGEATVTGVTLAIGPFTLRSTDRDRTE